MKTIPIYFACAIEDCNHKVLAQKKMHSKMTKSAMKAFRKIKGHIKKEHTNTEKITEKKGFLGLFKK